MDQSTPFSSLTELSNAVASGDIGPVELTESYLSRIEALDGKLNAFRMATPERALDEARAAESMLAKGQTLGPLHGLPYAAKDLYDVAGLPTSAGAKVLEGAIAEHDCDTVRQLRQRGMVLLGKTNTVQFAYGGVGINHDHGTPHNPWNETPCAPGGSSSGSGVAVAAGMAPMALGTDTGGSVRIPAALCGISGLKTTVGRVSRAGVYPLSWSLDSVGPLARSVEDTALVYEAITGEEPGDSSTHGATAQRVRHQLDGDIRGLRIGIARTAFFDGVPARWSTPSKRPLRFLKNAVRRWWTSTLRTLNARSTLIQEASSFQPKHIPEPGPRGQPFRRAGPGRCAPGYQGKRRLGTRILG